MQRIISYQNLPVYAEFCDGCNRELNYDKDTEESAKVEFSFGYHSDRDGQNGTFVFCQFCAEALYQQLRQQFPAVAALEQSPID